MIVETYQSKLVQKALESGEVYRALPNLSLRNEYDALIDMLGLSCKCPVFGVVKGKKQNTGGKVSGSVRFTLDVPEGSYWLTEYAQWADFIYNFRNTKPGNYKVLQPDCEEMSIRQYNELLESLKTQKPLAQYECPQVVLEKIDPAWIKETKVMEEGGLISGLFKR